MQMSEVHEQRPPCSPLDNESVLRSALLSFDENTIELSRDRVGESTARGSPVRVREDRRRLYFQAEQKAYYWNRVQIDTCSQIKSCGLHIRPQTVFLKGTRVILQSISCERRTHSGLPIVDGGAAAGEWEPGKAAAKWTLPQCD